MQQVKIDQAQAQLTDLVRAALNGEIILITNNNHQIVQLVPVPLSSRKPKFGSAKGLVTISDDFDAPLSDFENYQ